jgi:hypothetical protein
MAAIIVTERPLRTRMRGRDLVAQNAVSWRSIRGFGGQWQGSSDWIGQIAGWLKSVSLAWNSTHEWRHQVMRIQSKRTLECRRGHARSEFGAKECRGKVRCCACTRINGRGLTREHLAMALRG